MREDVEAVEEVQSENQLEEEENVNQGNPQEEEEQPEKEITEEEKDFISPEAKELWNKVMADKEFVCERGFGKLVSPFSEVIKKNVGNSFASTRHQDFQLLQENSIQIWWE